METDLDTILMITLATAAPCQVVYIPFSRNEVHIYLKCLKKNKSSAVVNDINSKGINNENI